MTFLQRISEYHKAKDGLGDTPDTAPELLYAQQHEALFDIIMTLCSDGPTVRSHSNVLHDTNCWLALRCFPGVHQSFEVVHDTACYPGPGRHVLVLYSHIYSIGYRPLARLFFPNEERVYCP